MKTLFALLALTLPALGTVLGIRPCTDADYSETLTATDNPRVTAQATQSTATVNGRVTVTSTGPTVMHDQQISVEAAGTLAPNLAGGVWTSSNPAVATVNGSGFVTQVGDGTTTITHATFHGNFSLALTLATTAPTTQATVTGWPGGTLGADLNSEVDTRIAASPGGTLTTRGYMFTTADDADDVYVRSTGNVFASVDLTGTSVWQSEGQASNSKFTITLVTPVDALGILHETHPPGTVFEWIDNANAPHYARVLASLYVDGFSLHHLQWQASRTDPTAVAAPTTLHVCKVMPANWQSYAPDHTLNYFPLIGLSQNRQTWVADAPYYCYQSAGLILGITPSEAARAAYTYSAYSGDSGTPILGLVYGEAVLLATMLGGGGGTVGGPLVTPCIGDIDAALAGFSGDSYQLTTVDLSSFSGPY